MQKKIGRPATEEHERKNRNVRLTDDEWQIFRLLLGPKWLREQIAKANNELTSK